MPHLHPGPHVLPGRQLVGQAGRQRQARLPKKHPWQRAPGQPGQKRAARLPVRQRRLQRGALRNPPLLAQRKQPPGRQAHARPPPTKPRRSRLIPQGYLQRISRLVRQLPVQSRAQLQNPALRASHPGLQKQPRRPQLPRVHPKLAWQGKAGQFRCLQPLNRKRSRPKRANAGRLPRLMRNCRRVLRKRASRQPGPKRRMQGRLLNNPVCGMGLRHKPLRSRLPSRKPRAAGLLAAARKIKGHRRLHGSIRLSRPACLCGGR